MKIQLPELSLPIKVDLVDTEGYPFPFSLQNGQMLVEASEGETFRIRLENPNTPELMDEEVPKIYLVAAVDGINISNLEVINWDRLPRGFVWYFESGKPVQVDYLSGWMLDQGKTWNFSFSKGEDSLLATHFPDLYKKHSKEWLGHIELGFYVENQEAREAFTQSMAAEAAKEGYSYPLDDEPFLFKDSADPEPCAIARISYRVRA